MEEKWKEQRNAHENSQKKTNWTSLDITLTNPETEKSEEGEEEPRKSPERGPEKSKGEGKEKNH